MTVDGFCVALLAALAGVFIGGLLGRVVTIAIDKWEHRNDRP